MIEERREGKGGGKGGKEDGRKVWRSKGEKEENISNYGRKVCNKEVKIYT